MLLNRRGMTLVVTALVAASAAVTAQGTGFQVTYLGHATFEVQSPDGTIIMIDPFLSENPQTPVGQRDPSQYRPNAVLVSHSHNDHAADAVAVALASGAQVIAAVEHVAVLGVPAAQQDGGNVGGKFTVGDVTVTLVPALHSSDPGGRPLGFILEAPGAPSIYHSGDTWIFSDMALIQELFSPSVLLLQAGGGAFNMYPTTAALAVTKYFTTAGAIIPMHFGTFTGLATEAQVRAAFASDARLTVMTPGQTVMFSAGAAQTPTPTTDTTITITSSGVSPPSVTVAAGSRVTFVNNDSSAHDMSSDDHPAHTECPEINEVGFLAAGQSGQTGNLTTARTCSYHDHNQSTNTSLQGTIVIQ